MLPFEVQANPRTAVFETNTEEKCSNTSIANRLETDSSVLAFRAKMCHGPLPIC